jgi:outer membrane receptor protein involved in Fe transport
VKGLELELAVRPTARDFLLANFSYFSAEQRGTCVRPQPDGSCTGDANVISDEITDIPRTRVNVAAAARPVGLPLELLGRPHGGAYRALGQLQLAFVYHHVGDSRSNARVTFEELNFPFRNPGYDRVDVGLTYPFRWLGGAMSLQLFVDNLTDADVAEPLVLTLEPRPAEGYFLPRPGRTFTTRLEARY